VIEDMPEHRVALLLRIRQVLKDRLADLAKSEHRSLNQQIEFILEHFLSDKANEQQSGKGGHG
jgi:hypothetical protein